MEGVLCGLGLCRSSAPNRLTALTETAETIMRNLRPEELKHVYGGWGHGGGEGKSSGKGSKGSGSKGSK